MDYDLIVVKTLERVYKNYYYIIRGEEYHELEEEQVLFDGADLIPYVSEIQEKIAEYSRVGHEDDKTDNLMDYFDGSAAIKEKVLSAVPSVKEADGVLYGCTILELKEYLETEELSELCEYLTGQYSDGWGEGFEQQEIPVEGGELCIHFWRPWILNFNRQNQKSQKKSRRNKKIRQMFRNARRCSFWEWMEMCLRLWQGQVNCFRKMGRDKRQKK